MFVAMLVAPGIKRRDRWVSLVESKAEIRATVAGPAAAGMMLLGTTQEYSSNGEESQFFLDQSLNVKTSQ